jgi:hypothetical protein
MYCRNADPRVSLNDALSLRFCYRFDSMPRIICLYSFRDQIMSTSPATAEISDDDRTTATGLARYAYEYIEAARLVDADGAEHHPRRSTSPTPAYFLAHHGIELCLKAFLRHKGIAPRQLAGRTFVHDLHACYRKAKELGLHEVFKEHANDALAMDLLVGLNVGHGMRYIKTGAKEFPSWSIVDPLAVRLHQAIAPLTGYHSFTAIFGGYD